MTTFEILFSDLKKEVQSALTEFYGGESPQEHVPLIIFELESEE